MKEYRKSQYNYETKTHSGNLIYNALYNSLIRMNDLEYEQYLSMQFESKELFNALYEQGIIIDNHIDELEVYNIYTELMMKFHNEQMYLTVAPAMDCNARCFYCYEAGVRCGKMSNETADKIIEKLQNANLKKPLMLTWFGGEPLLNQEWMDYFSKSLNDVGIEFSGFMITNGSKIDDEVIKKMKNNWNVNSVQITLDGDDEEYCKRKNYTDQDDSVYFMLLSNIKKLVKHDISVQIRMNIDMENTESILNLISDLEQVFYKNDNVTFYPAFLTGGKRKLSEEEKIEIVKKILNKVKNPSKFPVASYFQKMPKIHACYINDKNALSVDANGNIYNCEHLLGHPESAIGNVYKEFNQENNVRKISGRREECQKCVFLPKCQGGCQSAYLQGEEPCFIEKYIIKAYMELL